MLNFNFHKIISIIALAFSLFFVNTANAQLELKTNPFLFAFGPVTMAAEVGVNRNVGVELASYFDPADNYIVYLNGKYYLNERKGIDGFHIGAFTGVANEEFGLGFLLGYKWTSRHNIVFELGGGLGRTLSVWDEDNILPYLRLDVGYRFQFKKSVNTKSDN